MIVQANPDGGEPNPDEYQIGTPFPHHKTDSMIAHFVDSISTTLRAAGYPTKDAFRGAVGMGYNLDRYHIASLDSPMTRNNSAN